MKEIKKLEQKILEANIAYYGGTSIIDDDEYDAIVYELSLLDPDNKILKSIGAKPTSKEWEKEKHLSPLGSLLKVNTPDEMEDWLDSTGKNKTVIVTEKLDGLSIGCQYENGSLTKACLRGNGLEGENIITNVLKMHGVVNSLPGFSGTLRGEIVLTKTNHKKYFSDYSNPRNGASGICRDLKGDGAKHLTLMFYQLIGDDEFKTEIEQLEFIKANGGITPNYYICKSTKEVNDIWTKYQNGLRDSLDFEIDGLVVSFADLEFQNSLGETNLKPKGKKAFKFANQFVKTTVKDITWVCGASGRVTPICWLEPVSLLGSRVEKASVYNIAYVNKLGLDVGAKVLVCKANEIIPRVEKVVESTNTTAKYPKKCPSCSYDLKLHGEYLVCDNYTGCKAQISGRVDNWISELNILEFGSSLIEKLIESGKVKDVSDLYLLTEDDLSSLDRMGEKSAKKCMKLLWEGSNVTLEVFVGALSIPLIGQSTVKQIMSKGFDTLDKLMSANVSQLENVPNVGPTRSASLVDGLASNKSIIERLLANGVKIKDKVKGSLSGKSFAITGSLSMKRAEVEKMITDAGGEVKSSVGKGTTYLITSDPNSTSSKIQSAKKNGTKILSEADLMVMLGV